MESKTYWVGDRPGPAWIFQVLDQRTGTPFNLGGFPNVKAVMVDTDNRRVEFPANNVAMTNPAEGVVTFLWPTESVLKRPGIYLLQLEFSGLNGTRRTTVQEIKVKALGGVTK